MFELAYDEVCQTNSFSYPSQLIKSTLPPTQRFYTAALIMLCITVKGVDYITCLQSNIMPSAM